MPEPSDIDRVWDIIEQHSVGMLTTQSADGLRSRPLDARPDRAPTPGRWTDASSWWSAPRRRPSPRIR